MLKLNKHKVLSRIFSVVIVVVLLLSSAINVAAETSTYSSGVSSNDGRNSFNGAPFSWNAYMLSMYAEEDFYFHSSISPVIYLEDYDYYYNNTTSNLSTANDIFELNYNFSNFEYSPNLFISAFPIGFAASNFDFSFTTTNYTVDSFTIEAQDFYYYITPDYSSWDDTDDNSYIELALSLGDVSDSLSSGTGLEPTFEMYYTFGGNLGTAEDRLYYSSDAAFDGDDLLFYPGDDVIEFYLDEYPDGYLMYIEYACLTLYPSDGSTFTINDGIYYTDFFNYRDIDLESYEEPISPINPGVFKDYTSWIGTAVGGFLDLEFVDGFTLGGILMVLIAFMVTMWFLKVFAGG